MYSLLSNLLVACLLWNGVTSQFECFTFPMSTPSARQRQDKESEFRVGIRNFFMNSLKKQERCLYRNLSSISINYSSKHLSGKDICLA